MTSPPLPLRWLSVPTPRRRFHYCLALCLILILFYPFHSSLLPTLTASPVPLIARPLPAHSLLSRPISHDLTTIPKIIHQTWFPAGSNMTERAQEWVHTLRAQNPDWEYVLWDDETNRRLVQEHFPWFLEAYDALPAEIQRADVARNFYMFLYGGMYADVDTEALRPVAPLFASHDTTLAAHMSTLSRPSQDCIQRTFLGRMSHDMDVLSNAAVPNGWMASPPGHPFWLIPVLYVLDKPADWDGSVEGLTGPGALGKTIKQYLDTNFSGKTARQHVCDSVRRHDSSWGLYCEDAGQIKDSMVLLPQKQIYPFSWVDDKDSVCLAAWNNPAFDAEACKRVIGVDDWPSYFITYCTHSW